MSRKCALIFLIYTCHFLWRMIDNYAKEITNLLLKCGVMRDVIGIILEYYHIVPLGSVNFFYCQKQRIDGEHQLTTIYRLVWTSSRLINKKIYSGKCINNAFCSNEYLYFYDGNDTFFEYNAETEELISTPCDKISQRYNTAIDCYSRKKFKKIVHKTEPHSSNRNQFTHLYPRGCEIGCPNGIYIFEARVGLYGAGKMCFYDENKDDGKNPTPIEYLGFFPLRYVPRVVIGNYILLYQNRLGCLYNIENHTWQFKYTYDNLLPVDCSGGNCRMYYDSTQDRLWCIELNSKSIDFYSLDNPLEYRLSKWILRMSQPNLNYELIFPMSEDVRRYRDNNYIPY